jgi:hypothetical protein
VREGSVAEVGEELLDDGVAAVLLLGLDELVRAVGEDGVVAPGGEQLALSRRGILVLVADAADDQPGGDMQFLALRYWQVNNTANESRSDALLKTVEAGISSSIEVS